MITIKCPCGKTILTFQSKIGRKKYCSKKCFYKYRKRPNGLSYNIVIKNNGWFKKGHIPFHKGTKGIRKATPGSIKKREHRGKNTEFKKGRYPWNGGKKIWNGNRSDYDKLHYWVKKQKGKPTKCSYCGTTKKLLWANKSQKYKKDLDDWFSLCRSCHSKYDSDFIKKNIIKEI